MDDEVLRFENSGQLICSTNYWDTEIAAAGKVICTINAGAIRVLLPRLLSPALDQMRPAPHVVLTIGMWRKRPDSVELMWDDSTRTPYVIYLSAEAFINGLPTAPPPDRQWNLAVWIEREGQPRIAGEWTCYWRREKSLPCLKPWVFQ